MFENVQTDQSMRCFVVRGHDPAVRAVSAADPVEERSYLSLDGLVRNEDDPLYRLVGTRPDEGAEKERLSALAPSVRTNAATKLRRSAGLPALGEGRVRMASPAATLVLAVTSMAPLR